MHIKRWPAAFWRRLCQSLQNAGCSPVLIVPPETMPPHADPTERALADLPAPPVAFRASLDKAAALLARCDLVVGVDTGLLHLASAVGTRYVGLFGPTNPEVTGPYDRTLGTTLVALVEKGAACGGCWRQFKYIDDRCAARLPGSCMAALSPERVFAACQVELARSERRTSLVSYQTLTGD